VKAYHQALFSRLMDSCRLLLYAENLSSTQMWHERFSPLNSARCIISSK